MVLVGEVSETHYVLSGDKLVLIRQASVVIIRTNNNCLRFEVAIR